MVRFCTLFNAEERTVTFLNGQTYPLTTLRALGMGSLLDAMFEFSEKLGSLGLEPDEMALFMAVVLVSAGEKGALFISGEGKQWQKLQSSDNEPRCSNCPNHSHWSPLCSSDRSGISDMRAVEQLQEGLIRALRSLITRRRPDDTTLFPKLLLRLPDLRTLNNLHSDKLLAFRIDPWAGCLVTEHTDKLFYTAIYSTPHTHTQAHTDSIFQRQDFLENWGTRSCAIWGVFLKRINEGSSEHIFDSLLVFMQCFGTNKHANTNSCIHINLNTSWKTLFQ